MCENVNNLMRYETSTTYQVPIWVEPKPEQLNNVVDGYNYEISYVKSLGSDNVYSIWQGKFIPKENVRCCYVEYDARVKIGNTNTDTIVHNVILIGNNMGTTSYTDAMFDVKEFGCASNYNQGAVRHDNSGRNIYPAYYGTWQFTSFESFGLNFLQTSSLTDSNLTNAVNNMICDDSTTMFNFLRAVSSAVPNSFFGGNTRGQYAGANFFNGLWFYPIGAHAYDYTITKLPFPVFKIEDTPSIIEYLLTGNDTGSYDPFDTNPKRKTIEDFSTNFNVYITPVGALTRFSVQAVNNDYAQLDEDERSKYCEWVMFGHENDGTVEHSPIGSPNLTVTFAKEIKNVSPNLYIMQLALAHSDETDFPPFVDDHSNIYQVWFNYDGTKETNIHVATVKRLDNNGSTVETLSKSSISDGYKFTSTTGDSVKIVFRAITINDLDDTYEDEEDIENGSTGTDVTVTTGSGYGTFKITDAQFETINKKLWSTDWTNVFKSSTIDPIKCVIACKSIPFTANGGTLKDIMIANMDTGVSANAINPIKSFTVSATAIPSYTGDFTDITMLKVHVFLPYIGWVDLPASEVVSRVAYPKYGLSARTKTLGFKYLVDFVDGACRCIVSVNGTERWYFDGNCAVDIPVTSDNHTQAVANAVRSGLGATLSLASAVGGAVSGNGMLMATGAVGTIQGALGTFPVYNYSATSSPSGYINASMNTHIMIIIERPNVQRPEGYAHSVGLPCMRRLPLGSLSGFTKCVDVDTTGINGAPGEIAFIKSALESGVYL